MAKKYYIELWEDIVEKLPSLEKDKMLTLYKGKNIVEIKSGEDLKQLVDRIKEKDFVQDRFVKEFLDQNLPTISKYIKDIPIDKTDLKDAYNSIFDELPEEVFEGENIVEVLTKLMNHIIRKIEVDFLLINIFNGKLEYQDHYRHVRIYEFYYQILRLIHNLEDYQIIFEKALYGLERIFLTNIIFNDKKLSKEELELFRQAFNTTGRSLVSFKENLLLIETRIKKETTFLKRTATRLIPENYLQEQEKLSVLIKKLLLKIEESIKDTEDRKRKLEYYYKKNKGIITKENIKYLLSLIAEGLS